VFAAPSKNTCSYRWARTPALAPTVELVADEAIQILEGQPLRPRQFAGVVRLAEAPGPGGKPLLMLGDA